MTNVKLFVFCSNRYRKFVNHTIESIEINVKDKISKKYLVTPVPMKVSGFVNILDHEIWNTIDNDMANYKLYDDAYHRQQLLKLGLNNIEKGNLLIVDSDLIFLNPIKFIENKRYNLYTSVEYDEMYFTMIKSLFNFDKQTKKTQSFIADFALFNSEVLYSLQRDIENNFHKNWVSTINDLVDLMDDAPTVGLSEYEIYGNYLMNKYPHLVNKIIDPLNYVQTMEMDWEDSSTLELIEKVKKITNNNYQCILINDVYKELNLSW